MKFAKLFDYPNDLQILVTKEIDDALADDNEVIYKVCFEVQFSGVSAKIGLDFSEEDKRDIAFDAVTSEQAKGLFDKLFDHVEGWT